MSQDVTCPNCRQSNAAYDRAHSQRRAAESESVALRVQLAALQSDLDAAAGELRVSVRDCPPGSLPGKLLSANVLLRHENSDLLSRAVDAEHIVDLARHAMDARKTGWDLQKTCSLGEAYDKLTEAIAAWEKAR